MFKRYVISIVDQIKDFLYGLSVSGNILGVLSLFGYWLIPDNKHLFPLFIGFIVIGIISKTFSSFIPCKIDLIKIIYFDKNKRMGLKNAIDFLQDIEDDIARDTLNDLEQILNDRVDSIMDILLKEKESNECE